MSSMARRSPIAKFSAKGYGQYKPPISGPAKKALKSKKKQT